MPTKKTATRKSGTSKAATENTNDYASTGAAPRKVRAREETAKTRSPRRSKSPSAQPVEELVATVVAVEDVGSVEGTSADEVDAFEIDYLTDDLDSPETDETAEEEEIQLATQLAVDVDEEEDFTEADVEAVDYHSRNVTFAHRRAELKARIATLNKISADKRTVEQSVELSRTHSMLDDATREMVEANYGLVRQYVRRFTSNTSQANSEDFESAGILGLVKAIDSYDPEQGKFASWAWKQITREVLKAVHSFEFPHLTPGDFEQRPHVLAAQRKLSGPENSRTETPRPNAVSVAAEAKTTVATATRIMDAQRHDSLSTPVGEDGDSEMGEFLPDPGPSVEDVVVDKLSRQVLDIAGLACLDPRERLVLTRRFGLDCEREQKLNSIGRSLNLSREAVRQIEGKAMAKIMHPLTLRILLRQGRA